MVAILSRGDELMSQDLVLKRLHHFEIQFNVGIAFTIR